MSSDESAEWWSSKVSEMRPGVIRFRGYPIEEIIDELSFTQVIWLLLRGDIPTEGQAFLLERALLAGADHGPQAPSIAIARMAVTCGIGINNAVASSINVLGDVHGGAGEQLMEIMESLVGQDRSIEESVAKLVKEYRAPGKYLPGFGHRFHPTDPRRAPLLAAVERAVERGEISGTYLKAGLEIERQLNRDRSRPLPMNIDGSTAIIYSELGFAPTLGRGLFVLSRSVGALSHAWEESQSGLRNKGPIPRSVLPAYIGENPRSVHF